jgi:CheY-like chemotaxis protein
MSGIELARRIRQLCPTCKVLLISGHASISDFMQRAKDDGNPIDYYLMKPVHPAVLLKKVEEMMNAHSITSAYKHQSFL